MQVHLRIARPVSDLTRAARMYEDGLTLVRLGEFHDHEGFDGVMLGTPQSDYHLELTFCRRHPVSATPTPEDLLVFYVQDRQEWTRRCQLMRDAGFVEVEPFNPYWSRRGCTFQDPDGYRVVIQQDAWVNSPEAVPPGSASGAA